MPRIPNLTIPRLPQGPSQVPLDLQHHLYLGMSEAMIGIAAKIISEHRAGEPIISRLPIVTGVHKEIEDMIKSGASPHSVRNICKSLRYYFAWCDREGRLGGETDAFSDYTDWCHHLIARANGLAQLPDSRVAPLGINTKSTQRKDQINIETALDLASMVSRVLTPALGMERPIVRFSRLPALAANARAPYRKSDTVSFGEASKFGEFLVQVCDSLTVEKVRSPLPVQIELNSGHTFNEWCKLKPPENVKALQGLTSTASRNVVIRDRKQWEEDGTVRTQYTLINLRIECELLIFYAYLAGWPV